MYTNAFYYIGHFSKFIKPGARRIISASNRDVLQTTAFVNPDGSVAVVIMNRTGTDSPFHLWIKGKAIQLPGSAHSIQTVVIRNN